MTHLMQRPAYNTKPCPSLRLCYPLNPRPPQSRKRPPRNNTNKIRTIVLGIPPTSDLKGTNNESRYANHKSNKPKNLGR